MKLSYLPAFILSVLLACSCANKQNNTDASSILDATRPKPTKPVDFGEIGNSSKNASKNIDGAISDTEKTQGNIKNLEKKLEEAKGYNAKMAALIPLLEATNLKAKESLERIQKEAEALRVEMEEELLLAKQNAAESKAKLLKANESIEKLKDEVKKQELISQAKEQEIKTLRDRDELAVKIIKEKDKTIDDKNKEVKKAKAAEEKAKLKAESRKKYMWIVWGLGFWLLIKALGSLGAWSPQGRVAKLLVG